MSFAQIRGDQFESAKKRGKASLTYVYNNATDFAKANEQGKVQGVLIDLMEEFQTFVKSQYAIEVDVEFEEIEQSNFSKFLTVVRDSEGGVFGLSNASISEKRMKFLQFSEPFINNITVLVTHSSVPTITDLRQLRQVSNGMKAFSVTSSIYLPRLERIKSDHYPEMQIEFFNSGLGVMEALTNDQEAFAIIDLLYYLSFYKQGFPVKRHSIGDEQGDAFGIIMPKNSDWKPVLDEFFASGFLKSAKYREIISNHLGKSAVRLVDF